MTNEGRACDMCAPFLPSCFDASCVYEIKNGIFG